MIWSSLCALLCIVIIMIGYEVVLTPNVLQGKFNQSLCSNFTLDESPAKRLVLFMVDGMKEVSADTKWVSSFIKDAGRGVSIAARPMTRPGVVAMFSGHYEDLFTSLPTIFGYNTGKDSIFHYVDHTFYFGPDESIKYFKGGDKWISVTYPMDHLDTKNRPYSSDDYVANSIQEMFAKPLSKVLSSKNIFFIHLSGLDLVGHTARKGSNLLEKGIYRMGSMISRTMEIFDNYYQDNSTAYIITSDHGMSEWGTHADSSPEEIRTPIIVSGSGCAAGILPTIKQVDVCPITAALLGIPVPVESIGILHKQFLNTTDSSLAYSSMCSAMELADLCQTTWERIQSGLLIKHFLAQTMAKRNYAKYLKTLAELMQNKNYTEVVKVSENLTNLSLDCITNIQNFYKTSFLFVLLMSYVAWIFGTVCTISVDIKSDRFNSCAGRVIVVLTCAGYIVMLVLSIISVILEHLPKYYIIFIVVPSLVWLSTTLKTTDCLATVLKMKQFTMLVYFLSLLIMAEYTYWVKYMPYLFGIYLIPYACVLAVLNYSYVPRNVTWLWLITSTALMLAPNIPLLGLPESPLLLNTSSALWILGSCLFGYTLDLRAKECLVTLAAAAIICMATWIIDLTYLGPKLVLRILAWSVLPMPAIIILFSSSVLAERLLQIVLSFAGPYILLSLRHEGIVLLLMSLNLYCWMRLEASSPQYKGQIFVRGLTLHYYCVLSVYASGNLPYISSFDIMWTRLFITVLNDIIMGSLIIYKLLLFLTIVVCFFCATCKYVGKGLNQMLLIAILLSAATSLRHSFCILVSNGAVAALPEFLLGNGHFLLILIPFNLAPILVNVKKHQS